MENVYYTRRAGGLWIKCNLAHADDHVMVAYDRQEMVDDNFHATPFQVADGRHNVRAIAELVADWCKSQGYV